VFEVGKVLEVFVGIFRIGRFGHILIGSGLLRTRFRRGRRLGRVTHENRFMFG
jgi:hypothetical protein